MQVGGGGGGEGLGLKEVYFRRCCLHSQGSQKRSKNLEATVHLQLAFHDAIVA